MVPMSAKRAGVTLVELLVVVALAGLVAGIIATTLSRQEQFYRRAAETGFVRESVRDAMDVLSMDVRQMSVADTVRLMGDSAIEFFSAAGMSVVCTAAGNEIGLPAVQASGNSLSGYLTQPDTGDLAAFYGSSTVGEPLWERHRIAGVGTRSISNGCPASSGFSPSSDLDAGSSGLVLALASPLGDGVKPGAPVRFLRRGRYSLYHASDGEWYLGYRRCNATGPSVCGAIQPISGAYRPYDADPRSSGLVFEYFDSSGQRLHATSALALARVDITARAESGSGASIGGMVGRIVDSATVTVAVRNRTR
jgi:prepilin-type N-terminal cleavage/methylation domain-containing protein